MDCKTPLSERYVGIDDVTKEIMLADFQKCTPCSWWCLPYTIIINRRRVGGYVQHLKAIYPHFQHTTVVVGGSALCARTVCMHTIHHKKDTESLGRISVCYGKNTSWYSLKCCFEIHLHEQANAGLHA
jgi:hypothetical protein